MAIQRDGVDITGDVDFDDVASGDWSITDEAAREYVERATSIVASLVRSTLGPRGMEKLIATQNPQGVPEIIQSTDAEQILAAIERGAGFNHPVAALFIDAIDSMQRGLGDGTTTAMILTAELIERGVDLTEEGLHPGTIVVGYAMASNHAGQVLDALSRPVSADDFDQIKQVAASSMTADLDPRLRDQYADAIAEAIGRLAANSDGGLLDTDTVKILAGRGEGTGLRDGLIIRRFPSLLHESEEAVSEFDWGLDFPEPTADVGLAITEREIDFEESATSFGGEGWDT
ncbi:MAG: TCP-1/cpn60 chaperonin family protein, partial [Halobacteriales archaeon]|nr:TCP-1/cpn60 chaperonin family protein [Halobacteriales archaeon]